MDIDIDTFPYLPTIVNSDVRGAMPTTLNPDIAIDSSILLDRFAMSVI